MFSKSNDPFLRLAVFTPEIPNASLVNPGLTRQRNGMLTFTLEKRSEIGFRTIKICREDESGRLESDPVIQWK